MTHSNAFEYKKKDFESNCVCEDKAVFKMVAEEGFEPPTFGL